MPPLVRRRGNAYDVSVPTSPAVVEFNPWLESQPRSSSGQLEFNIFAVRRLFEFLEQSESELNETDKSLLKELRPHVRRFQRNERQVFRILSQRRPREERRGKPLQAIRPLRLRPARSRESSPRRRLRTTAAASRDGPFADEDDPENHLNIL
jgi:hypothetical protein